jgi:hypothetical protein
VALSNIKGSRMKIQGRASDNSSKEFTDDEIQDWIHRQDAERIFDVQAARIAIEDARSMHLLAMSKTSKVYQLKAESTMPNQRGDKGASGDKGRRL